MGQKYAHLDANRFVIGFYDEHIHGDEGTPDEAVPITDDDWQYLLEGQSDGKRMKVNEDGSPELVEPLAPTPMQLAAAARAQRNEALKATDWIVTQQQESILTGAPVSNPDRVKAFATYRQALRDVPQQAGFPESIDWPEEPGTSQ